MKEELLSWTDSVLNKVGTKNPMANLLMPFVKNAINNKIDNFVEAIDKYSVFFTDKDGNINKNLFEDFMNHFQTMDKTKHSMFGMDLTIGKGEIELLPDNPMLNTFFNSGIKFNQEDITHLKNLVWNHFTKR